MDEKQEKTYVELWEETDPPYDYTDRGQKYYLYGSKRLTKMIQFCADNKVDNNIINQLMALDPAEEAENENKEQRYKDLKRMSRFQKDLLKFRGNIYKFPKLTKKKIKKLKKNASTADIKKD